MGNLDKSREIYDWVSKLCIGLGADYADMVPFEKYAKATEGLGKPSSAARALFGGAEHIERVDCLVRRIAASTGDRSPTCWTRSSRWWMNVWRKSGQHGEGWLALLSQTYLNHHSFKSAL